MLNEEWRKESVYGNSTEANPSVYSAFLASNCYKMRNKMDPYYVESAIAGVYNGKIHLSYTDLYGNSFELDYIATSFARVLCPPIIEARHKVDMSYDDAKALLLDCFRGLYARNKMSGRDVVLCSVTDKGFVDEQETISINYSYESMKNKEDFI